MGTLGRWGVATGPAAAGPDRRTRALVVLALLGAASSIAALLLHAAGWLAMPYAVSFLTVPGLVLLLAVLGYAGRIRHRLLLNRLRVGTVAGALGLLAYDLGRWLLQAALPPGFDAFGPVLSFGALITGAPVTAAPAIVAGWAYHLSNGWTFALAYALIAGRARWWWGLVFGAILEAGMIAVYPVLFRELAYEPFLIVSVAGHALYGAVVGLVCQRYAMPGRR